MSYKDAHRPYLLCINCNNVYEKFLLKKVRLLFLFENKKRPGRMGNNLSV